MILMTTSLEKKLATMMNYVVEHRAGRAATNTKMFDSMLDDPEVAEWLDKARKENLVDLTRFS